MNLSFAGCGFLGIYHVGVAVCFKKYAPHLLLGKISGASFGALSACCLLCELPIGELTSDVLRVVGEARAGSLGPFSPSFNIQNVLLEGMHKYLPPDAHKIVSGKLHISLTRVYDGKNVIVSEFPTRDDLLQALLASCFVPVFSGLVPPRFHGVRYMDGGFSDNLPVLDENTITVSPFCGESDICPRDLSSQLFHVNVANTSIELSRQNMTRFARILFPPRAEVLSSMCRQGFDDALRFLQRNQMISCTRCLQLSGAFSLHELEPEEECEQCRAHRRLALTDDLPDTVMTIFRDAIRSANTGLANWLMRRYPVRCLTLLAIPYRLPLDIVLATFTNYVGGRVERHSVQVQGTPGRRRCGHAGDARVLRSTPRMSRGVWRVSRALLHQLHALTFAHRRSGSGSGSGYYKRDRERDHRPAHHRLQLLDTRRSSCGSGEDSTVEQLVSVTSQHEALLAYYYLDEHDKLNVTEIYDVTEADTDAVQSPAERDLNRQLQFDNDWSSHFIGDTDELELEALEALDEDALADRNIFSEPESEWPAPSPSPSPASPSDSDADQPEADRRQSYRIA